MLAPTVLYAHVTEALWRAGVVPHYCANVTGHGWRKLLRHPAAFSYHITRVPEVPPVLRFIQQHAGLDERQAYGTFNMGAGFALFVAADEAARTVRIAGQCGIGALLAGAVHEGPKQLTIEPLGLRFGADDLQLR
jgi:phosphoribosylformylglycinamidine cyclo-ligase